MPIATHVTSSLSCDKCQRAEQFTATYGNGTKPLWRAAGWSVSINHQVLTVRCRACSRGRKAAKPDPVLPLAPTPAAAAPIVTGLRIDMLLAGGR